MIRKYHRKKLKRVIHVYRTHTQWNHFFFFKPGNDWVAEHRLISQWKHWGLSCLKIKTELTTVTFYTSQQTRLTWEGVTNGLFPYSDINASMKGIHRAQSTMIPNSIYLSISYKGMFPSPSQCEKTLSLKINRGRVVLTEVMAFVTKQSMRKPSMWTDF